MGTPISVRFDDELMRYFSYVVEKKQMTKADFIRQAVMEKLEDDYDIDRADQAYQEWIEKGKKTHSHAEMMKRYG